MTIRQTVRHLFACVENMRIRTRLLVLMLLFGAAVGINILALLYLARSVSASLEVIESARLRQLVAVEMHEKLRNAEAALYRYHLEDEAGFATQFDDQISSFGASVATYHSLISTPEEQAWANDLGESRQNIQRLGRDLIRLHDQQANDLKTIIAAHEQLSDLLTGQLGPLRLADPDYQRAVDGMDEKARGMLLAVTAYLAEPDQGARGQFTEATIQFQQYLNEYRRLAVTEAELRGLPQIDASFTRLQTLGSQLISDRDRQQASYARFFAEIFQAGQHVIVGQIQPLETRQLAQAQQDLWSAVGSAILISLVTPILMTIIAALLAARLARGMNQNILALLRGADRVAAGNLEQPVSIRSTDELRRLAEAFNNMMTDLATRERRLKARLAELETLRQVSLHITSTLDLDQVLNEIARSVLGLVEASSVHILTREERTGALRVAASAGKSGTAAAASDRPDGLAAVVASTGQPHVMDGVTSEHLFDARDATNWRAPSSAAFPMKRGDQVLGVLRISSDVRRTFTTEEIRILNLLTDQAAVALSNARLYTTLLEREERVRSLMQKMAQIQDEERRLISLDLHDGLTQLVISANMHLNTLSAMIDQRMDPSERQELEASRRLIQSAIDEARRVISELRPTVVEDLGLADGLRRYVIDLSAAQGWRCETHINLNGIELSLPAETAIFRIAQEALSNARKHSHTDSIKVQLQRDDADLVLTVHDSGCGFDLVGLSDESSGVGLVSMRERARTLGGTCDITSQPGGGTAVSIRVPLDALQRSAHEP